MKRVLLAVALLALIIAVLPVTGGTAMGEDDVHFARALWYGDREQWDEAVEELDQVLLPASQNAEAQVVRATAYLRLNQQDRAAADFERALQLDHDGILALLQVDHRRLSEWVSLYLDRGSEAAEAGAAGSAVGYFTTVTELNPNDARAYAERGYVRTTMWKYEEAVADFDTSLRLDRGLILQPIAAEAYLWTGWDQGESGDYERAVELLDRAIEIDPALPNSYVHRGVALTFLGQYARAVADFDRAIDLLPEDASLYVHRGYALGEMGQPARAISDFNHAIALGDRDANSYVNRGAAFTDLGEFDRALADLTHAIELEPTNAIIHMNRGYTYAEMGEYLTALADFNEAIRLDPELAYAYVHRANAHFTLEDFAAAFRDFDRAVMIDPDDAWAYYNRGAAYCRLGRQERAREDFEKAIDLSPDLLEQIVGYVLAEGCGVLPDDSRA
jgi:tetratricopeptide (TPR) repeat protein